MISGFYYFYGRKAGSLWQVAGGAFPISHLLFAAGR